jgi:hypothetical protein
MHGSIEVSRIPAPAMLTVIAVILAIGLLFAFQEMGPKSAQAYSSATATITSTGEQDGHAGVAALNTGPNTAPRVKILGYHRSTTWCIFWWFTDSSGCGVFSGHPRTCDWVARLARLCR